MILADLIKPGSFARPATLATGATVGRVVSHSVAAGLDEEKHPKISRYHPLLQVSHLSHGRVKHLNPMPTPASGYGWWPPARRAVAYITTR